MTLWKAWKRGAQAAIGLIIGLGLTALVALAGAVMLANFLLFIGVEAVQNEVFADQLEEGAARSLWKYTAVVWGPLGVSLALRTLRDDLDRWHQEDAVKRRN